MEMMPPEYGRYGSRSYGDDASPCMGGMGQDMEMMPPGGMGGMGPDHMANMPPEVWAVCDQVIWK